MRLIFGVLFLSVVTPALAGEWALESFVVAVPDSVYSTQTNAVSTLTWNLWGKIIPKDRANKGWKKVRRTANPAQVWWLYDVTCLQIRDNISSARLAELKAILSDAGVKWEREWIGAVMVKYGLEYAEQGDAP